MNGSKSFVCRHRPVASVICSPQFIGPNQKINFLVTFKQQGRDNQMQQAIKHGPEFQQQNKAKITL